VSESSDCRLDGKTAIVTGASRGIGRAIALAFAHAGASVVVAARTEAPDPNTPGTIHSVVAEVEAGGGSALAVPCDLTQPDQISAMVERTLSTYDRIDVLVNNAGIMWLGNIIDTPLKRWELVLRVNLTGTFLCTQAVLPHMIERGSGVLIAVSTVGVRMVDQGSNVYWVSKQAIERLYHGLAVELRPRGVTATVLAPTGVVDTPGWKKFSGGRQVPPDMIEAPEVMGTAALRLAAGDVPDAAGRVCYSRDLVPPEAGGARSGPG
jgi:citronellol/citronellal dehydrogenase